ncbi:hypothetical protein [Bifidobacterium sp. ESL0745]|uniref:hypothetical protein n=1 Tax=Bifidobacterium sp. ESL0745 TaxID=2983226 RepID=UPI0023F84EC2|nr:hypothetical protein [Bifidobacterium sp. ESL0745]MDF7665818.1 hypothetical protein [Bifidobacterium sp. ESL0745]
MIVLVSTPAQPELDGYFKLVTWPITATPTTSDPSFPINASDPDNTSTRDVRVGTAMVQSDGTWSMDDNTQINPLLQDHVRYHAWQTEETGGYFAFRYVRSSLIHKGAHAE